MSKLKDDINRLRAAVPAYKLIRFDKDAKVATTRAGEEENDRKGTKSKCVIS